MIAKLPAQPSRYRVAVWRELRRAGAMPLGGGTWALPSGPAATETIGQVRELVQRAPDGELIVLDAVAHEAQTGALLEASYTKAVEAEWGEFLRDCDKYSAELRHEIEIEKFTLAELEEEEQNLDRLRRWHRAIGMRDRFGAPSSSKARERLAGCVEELDDFSERVYRALGQ